MCKDFARSTELDIVHFLDLALFPKEIQKIYKVELNNYPQPFIPVGHQTQQIEGGP